MKFESPPQENFPKKETKSKKVLRAAILAGAVAGAAGVIPITRSIQEKVNTDNEGMNHVFSVQELSLQDQIKMLIGTTPYSSLVMEKSSKTIPGISSWLRSKTEAGLIHLYKSEMETLKDAKKNIQDIRSKSKKPILISADFEGGFVNHVGVTIDDLKKYGIPPEILIFRDAEYRAHLEKRKKDIALLKSNIEHPLPSQEWLGKEYQKILDEIQSALKSKNEEKINIATEKQKHFLSVMQGYGETIANICESVGINVVFGPNLDMVKNTDGDLPDEIDDRTYGNNYNVVSDLAVSYLRGFGNNGKVLPVIKHFGNSFTDKDGHTESSQSVTNIKDGSLLPYRNTINASSPEDQKKYWEQKRGEAEEELRVQKAKDDFELKKRIEASKPKRVLKPNKHKTKDGRTKTLNTVKTRLPKKVEKVLLKESNETLRIKEKIKNINQKILQAQTKGGFPLGVMTSVTSSNLYSWKNKPEQVIPVVYNAGQIKKIKEPKEKDGLGHKGIIVSDDLTMQSSNAYIDALHKLIIERGVSISGDALKVYEALSAGNTIALVKNIAGSEQKIAEEIEKLILQENSFNKERKILSPNSNGKNEGGPDLTPEKIEKLVKKVLELRVSMGLLEKTTIEGKDYYVLDPRIYNPTVSDVLINSFFSNQMPWTKKEGKPDKSQPSSVSLLIKAAKNFSLSLWRVSLPMIAPSFSGNEDRHIKNQSEKKKLIIVDKSFQRMFVYDLETRTKEKEYIVGIGKGGLIPRRYVGDHSTPTGTYELVQKRDDVWWRDEKKVPLPPEYGGADGGMLVLAGQWHPEIAIHGSVDKNLGQVSNGCVRVSNENINDLLQKTPLGSMVIITK